MTQYDLGLVVGADGKGITSIEKTDSSGLEDTYTITYTDETTSTFVVTNGAKGDKGDTGATGATGKGITSITKTGTSGKVDTYTITYSDNSTSTFTVTNGNDGNGIQSIEKTGSVGLVDNYRIHFTDSTYYDYQVTNGSGGGITHSDVYDDIILFADTVISTLQPYTIYNAKFDGTETIVASSGTVTATGGILSASGTYYAHLTDYLINNDNLWEVSFEAKADSNNCAVILSEHGQTTSDKFEITITSNGYAVSYYNSTKKHEANIGVGFNSNSWIPIKLKKTGSNTLEVTINNTTQTVTWNYLGNLLNLEFGVYAWQSSTINVRKLNIKTDLHIQTYDTTIYNPSLDGTENVTVITSPCSVDTTTNSLTGATGYLTTGFTNTSHWKIELQAKVNGNTGNCAILLINQGTSQRDKDEFQIGGTLNLNSYSGTSSTSSARPVSDSISTSTYTDVTIEKVNDKYLKVSVGDTVLKGFWDSVNGYDTICVGIDRWNNNADMRIKSIVVKAPSSEVE